MTDKDKDVQEWFQEHLGYNDVHRAITEELERDKIDHHIKPFTPQYQNLGVHADICEHGIGHQTCAICTGKPKASLLPVGRPCSACQGNHFDHTFVHFSLSNDLGGFCWEEDHYPNEGDILVSSNISEVTCPKCREYCQTLNDLKKSEGFSEDDIRRDDLPRDAFELIHELAYDHEGRDRWQYRTRAQQILKSNGLPVGRQLECGHNSVLDADLVGCGKAIKEAEIFRCVDCGVPFHRECASKHFIAGESVLTEAIANEQFRRDDVREGLRIVVSARDYLNEQIPKDWTATELLNSLWGTFMKEQSGWKKLASLLL